MSEFYGEESDNLTAIYQLFLRTPPKTPQAEKVQREFLDWYATTKNKSWFYISEADVANATAYRNTFNRANAVTPEAKKKVEEVIATGYTSGKVARDPKIDESWKDEQAGSKTGLPGWQKWMLGVGIGVGITALGLVGIKVSQLVSKLR